MKRQYDSHQLNAFFASASWWRGVRFVVFGLLSILCVQTARAQFDMIWARDGLSTYSHYGHTIIPLGDQNDDGVNDWAVFAYGTGDPSETDSAYVEFFHGGNPMPTQPYMVIRQESDTRWYRQVEAAGDVNGDGYQDWLIVRLHGDPIDRRIVYIYFGGPDADDIPDAQVPLYWQASWTIPIGDFNGDGYSDICIYEDRGSSAHPYCRLVLGGVSVDTTAAWHLTSRRPGDAFPYTHGDFNDDGLQDIVTVNLNEDTTYFYWGSADPDTVPDVIWDHEGTGILGGVGDLNGDGFDELLIARRDAADLTFGRPEMPHVVDTQLSFPCGGDGPHDFFAAGDVNHDGYQDALVVAEYCEDSMWGTARIYLGNPWVNPAATFTVRGGAAPSNIIGMLDGTGLRDVNGDGIDDFGICGWTISAFAGERGRAAIFAGDSTVHAPVSEPHPELPKNFTVSVFPNPFNDATSIRLDLPTGGGLVELTVYDLLGRQVSTWTAPALPGLSLHRFQARDGTGADLASGIYLLRVTHNSLTQIQELVLIK
jgi:hypothetical protein